MALNIPNIYVFRFRPSQFPDKDHKFKVFDLEDQIDISSVTSKHSEVDEKNVHFDIALSKDREEQTIMVLFNHNYYTVIAEIIYRPIYKSWSFVRYYKFTFQVHQIYMTKDILVVVGAQTMSVFPYGIHARLIK